MHTKENPTYYRIELDDYSAAAFTGGSKIPSPKKSEKPLSLRFDMSSLLNRKMRTLSVNSR